MEKGQVSIEYMLVLGFMFALMVPLLVLYVSTQKDTTDTLIESQLHAAGTSLIDAAERVYFAGEPSQTQVTTYLPDNVKNISLTNNSIIYTVSGGPGQYELLIPSTAPLNGSLLTNKGLHIITLKAVNGTVQLTE